MNNIVDEINDNMRNKNMCEGSIIAYTTKFKHLMKNIYNNNTPDILNDDKILKDILEYINKDNIKSNEKINLLRSYVICLKSLKLECEKFEIELKKIKNNEKDNIQMIKETNEDKNMSLDEITKLRDEYKKDFNRLQRSKNDLYYVVLSLYTYLPPLRSEDFINTYLYYNCEKEDIKDKNYLCLTCKKLILTKYKTSKAYGVREIDIPNDLRDILHKYKMKTNSIYVISSPNNKKFHESSFHRLLLEATNKKISSSAIRKIYVSESIDKNMSVKDRKKAAQIMGHSISTQSIMYSKFSKLLHTEDDNINELIEQRKIIKKLLDDCDNKIYNLLLIKDI